VRAEDDEDAAGWPRKGETGDRHVGNCWWCSPAPLATAGKADEEWGKDDDDDVAGCPMIAVVVPRR
jgi:hypothetical protein